MLALVGSGEYLPEIEAMDRALMARLKEPARVVCLPTAAGLEGDAMVQSWMRRGVEHFERLGAEAAALPIIDMNTAQNPAYAVAIDEANFVYLSGGNPAHLYESLVDTAVWRAILNVHRRGGVVAGCSAGAMILGARIVGPGSNRNGFGLLPDTAIIPHFDEFPGFIGRIVRFFNDKTLTLVGIDGRTALLVDHGVYEVLGTGFVTLFTRAGKEKFAEGRIPDAYFKNGEDV